MHKYTKLYKAKGYTRSTLATLYGVCPDSISNRAKNPTPEQLLALDGLADRNSAVLIVDIEEMRWQSEEFEACMMAMDDAGIPRFDKNGSEYSLWGRAGLPEKGKQEESV